MSLSPVNNSLNKTPANFSDSLTSTMRFHYKAMNSFAKMIMSSFFQEIDVVGLENIPTEGPLIICANHNNQFVDGLLLFSKFPREIGFIIAAKLKSLRRPIIGFVAHKFNVIPVERPQDLAFEGKGTISSIKNNILQGKSTEFTKDFKVGDQILLKSRRDKEFVVKEIINDTEIHLLPNHVIPQDMENINSPFRAMPKIDQSRFFESVYKHLSKGRCIGVFPEGGSHDRTQIIELKPGVARMALGAHAKYGTKVKILPVGLNYDQRNEFRSKAIVEIGQPFEVPKELCELYDKDHNKAIGLLMKQIEKKLKACILQGPSQTFIQAIYTIRKLYKPDDLELKAGEELLLNRKIAKFINKLKGENPEMEKLVGKVTEYNEDLKALDLRDEEINDISRKYSNDIVPVVKSLGLFALSTIYCLPGILLMGPFVQIANVLAEIQRKKALKQSTIKLEAIDVVASYKIVNSSAIFPLASLGYTFLLHYGMKKTHVLPHYRKRITGGFIILWPLYLYSMTRPLDQFYKEQRFLRAKYLAYFHELKYKNIIKKRTELQITVKTLANSFGAKVWENFDLSRIIPKGRIDLELEELKVEKNP